MSENTIDILFGNSRVEAEIQEFSTVIQMAAPQMPLDDALLLARAIMARRQQIESLGEIKAKAIIESSIECVLKYGAIETLPRLQKLWNEIAAQEEGDR